MGVFTAVECPQCGSTNVDVAEPGSTQLRCLAGGHEFPHPDPEWFRDNVVGAGLAHGRATESGESIAGKRSANDVRQLLGAALEQKLADLGAERRWVWVVDYTDTALVYEGEGGTFSVTYSLADDGTVTLGDPEAVQARTDYVPTGDAAPAPAAAPAADSGDAAGESAVRILGRITEAKDDDASGGRVFGVRVIAYGDSKNGRRYTQEVLEAAVPLYEGAKVYDHHRTEAEMATSTITGLVGSIRDVEASDDGLHGDLHLLPSAGHAAEVLDASLAATESGLPPLAGISHDVYATWKQITESGRRMSEAVAITKVNSADIVADPAAGGQATRMVAGGSGLITDDPVGEVPVRQTNTQESAVDKTELLDALKGLTPEERTELGFPALTPAADDPATEAVKPPAGAHTTEAETFTTKSFQGRMAIREACEEAGLTEAREAVVAQLGETFTEAQLDGVVKGYQAVVADLERRELVPSTGNAEVTKEALDKKTEALDAMFAGDYSKGYKSFKEAYVDITGTRPKSFDEDFNRTILRESAGAMYDSGARSTESMTTASWSEILGDSVTRRMIAEYGLPQLSSWQQVVSEMPPINDFRTQRIAAVGGYGVLPAVAQAGTYNALTSPTDEEATYAISKRGGTEDITLEMIANDDLRAITRIPKSLGRAASQTLYRFVWDILPTNGNVRDGLALFVAGHNNTDVAALSQANLSVGRRRLIKQTAYGDTSEVLGFTPRFLVVPPELEELAFQLCTSAVAIPGSGNSSDIPNIHQGLVPIVLPYYADANDWFLIVDPAMCPTIEVGFYQGRRDPELFTQADPTVGSVFNADKLTFKIRHIYGGTVLDHRGFYRATQP